MAEGVLNASNDTAKTKFQIQGKIHLCSKTVRAEHKFKAWIPLPEMTSLQAKCLIPCLRRRQWWLKAWVKEKEVTIEMETRPMHG
jgi:hypothetical protein